MEFQLPDFLTKVQDYRRPQGQRHRLSSLFLISLMAILSKQQSLKGVARFAKSNEEELTKALNLKHGVPKFNTFRSFFETIDTQSLVEHFIAWVESREEKSKENVAQTAPISIFDECIALDGKDVKATVAGGNTNLQNFVSVVSAFGHTSGLVYGMASYENGKSGETESLRGLLEKLGVVDKMITVDALHTKKND